MNRGGNNGVAGRWCPARRSHARGLTLIELLVVVCIITVLGALLLPAVSGVKTRGLQAKCSSNLRQLGLAMNVYANDNNGVFLPTSHTTGSRRINESWVYGLSDYLENVDKVRVCPADPPVRQKQILDRKATSYALNDLVFDSEEYNRLLKIPKLSKTLLAVVLSENRTPSATWDHIHGGEWTTWAGILNDNQADRFINGQRAKTSAQRLKGSSNYLFADGHVENITAKDFKKIVDGGVNPAAVPLE